MSKKTPYILIIIIFSGVLATIIYLRKNLKILLNERNFPVTLEKQALVPNDDKNGDARKYFPTDITYAEGKVQSKNLGFIFELPEGVSPYDGSISFSSNNERWTIKLKLPFGEVMTLQNGAELYENECTSEVTSQNFKTNIIVKYAKQESKMNDNCTGGEYYILWQATAEKFPETWTIMLKTTSENIEIQTASERAFLKVAKSFSAFEDQ